MACKCKKDSAYTRVLQLAANYARKHSVIVAIFFCSDWDFSEIDNFEPQKYEQYEYITPDYNS